MSDLKLFEIRSDKVTEIQGTSAKVEKSLQTLIETHLEAFLGVRFLATEFSTGKDHGGRMDTLGIDENRCPVIIEYKRATNQNVINQGLFYLDWLMDHKKDFEWLVLNTYGKEVADNVEWLAPRLLCVAGDFTKFDEHAVNQMNRNIELIRYRKYGEDLILFELVNATTAEGVERTPAKKTGHGEAKGKTVSEQLAEANAEITDRFEAIKAYLLAFGEDTQLKALKFYFAFKRIKNFACVEFRLQKNCILVYAKVNPEEVDLQANKGFLRDARRIGHFGTGDLEITIRNDEDFERAKPLLEKSYEAS